jgi:hypothetical protein
VRNFFQRFFCERRFFLDPVFVCLLLAQGVVGLWGITTPFSDGRLHWNWGPPFWLLHAEQINNVGLIEARFGVVSDVIIRDGRAVANGFYQSHPQLIGPVVALWTRLFGYEEWSARLLALALTMATTVLLWLAVRALFSTRVAQRTIVLWAMMPIVAIYGRKLDQEPLVLFFLALTLFGFALARRTTKRPWVFFFALLGACLADWSGFVFAACIGAVCVLFGKKGDRRFALFSGTAICVALGLLALQLAAQRAVTHGVVDLVSLYQFRSEAASPSVAVWLWQQWQYLVDNFGMLALGVFPLTVWFFIGRTSTHEEGDRLSHALLGAVVLGQLLYLIVVPQAASMHGYFQYYFSLPLAVGFALLLERIHLRDGNGKVATGFFTFCILMQCLGVVLLWNQIRRSWYGDATDVALLRETRTYPPTATVQALGGPKGWFDNPNISYYAGRNIALVTPGELPFPDVYVVAKEPADALMERLRMTNSTPVPTPIRRACSSHFCIIETYGQE